MAVCVSSAASDSPVIKQSGGLGFGFWDYGYLYIFEDSSEVYLSLLAIYYDANGNRYEYDYSGLINPSDVNFNTNSITLNTRIESQRTTYYTDWTTKTETVPIILNAQITNKGKPVNLNIEENASIKDYVGILKEGGNFNAKAGASIKDGSIVFNLPPQPKYVNGAFGTWSRVYNSLFGIPV